MIEVRFLKWPASPHWAFAGELLGEDEFGRWVGLAEGSPITGPRPQRRAHDAVLVARAGAWWVAEWAADPAELSLYVDICGPVTWAGDRLIALDLDLDVIQQRSGEILLVDEEEFEEHQVALSYPLELIEGARTAAGEVLDAVRSNREPFATRGLEWLSRFSSRPTPAAR